MSFRVDQKKSKKQNKAKQKQFVGDDKVGRRGGGGVLGGLRRVIQRTPSFLVGAHGPPTVGCLVVVPR